ncbi:neurofilament heavy polypeptide-like [Syngnathus typhle]|uniref:neurofilament heavy polypeptide-like n=1 Tax=Syngnathus typhle TaxID=161592 RepID=UPI002A6ABA03|nr:neurofilament heavy polypeptide-like [Syngnathus typhle]
MSEEDNHKTDDKKKRRRKKRKKKKKLCASNIPLQQPVEPNPVLKFPELVQVTPVPRGPTSKRRAPGKKSKDRLREPEPHLASESNTKEPTSAKARELTPAAAREPTLIEAREPTPTEARELKPAGARAPTPAGARAPTPAGARAPTPAGARARAPTPAGARAPTPAEAQDPTPPATPTPTPLEMQERECLRWEGVLQDPQAEEERLEMYRASRRRRYVAQRDAELADPLTRTPRRLLSLDSL